MKVFISWSGEQTRDLAHALKLFLDTAFAGHVHTFMSDADIAPGDRFLAAINTQLDAADLGLLLVTRVNQREPWLLFEAGALASKSARGSVIPILVDMERVELGAPLSQFQNVLGTSKVDFQKLWTRIRTETGNVPNERTLEILLNEALPLLEKAVAEAASSASGGEEPQRRTAEDMLGEILLGVNALVRRGTTASSDWVDINRLEEGWSAPNSRARDNGDLQLHVGQRIWHDEFGGGVVRAITGEGAKTVAHVTFGGVGPKKLLVKIAPIKVEPF